MPVLSFPGVAVWMATLLSEHIHHAITNFWCKSVDFESARNLTFGDLKQ